MMKSLQKALNLINGPRLRSSIFASKMSVNTATTRISLNDRFRILRQRASNAGPSPAAQRPQNVSGNARGSVRNKRLALQMANRPSVLAALRIKNKSIKQRLGNKNIGRGNAGFNRNGAKFGQRVRNNQNAGGMRNQQPQNQLVKSGRLRLNRNNFAGTMRVGGRRQRPNNNYVAGQRPNFGNKKRGFGNKRIIPKNVRIQRMKQFGLKGGNKQRVMNKGNRGGGKVGKFVGKFWQNKKPNKNQLDADLDAYMAKTKSHLDADLDAYMAEASTS